MIWDREDIGEERWEIWDREDIGEGRGDMG